MFEWQNIDEIYKIPDFMIEKNMVLRIKLKIDQELDEFDKNFMQSNLSHWEYPYAEKNIKPFKVLNWQNEKFGFIFDIMVIKKKSDIDELKLFCQDIKGIYNLKKVAVVEFSVTKKNTD